MIKVDEIDIHSIKCPKCNSTVAIHVKGDIVEQVECDDCDYVLKEDEIK